MDCQDMWIALQAYVDGDLGPEQVTPLERHLANCGGCRAELARLQAVVEALETWPLVEEPAQMADRVLARVKPRPVLPRFRLRWSDLAISLAGTAGAAVAITLLSRYLIPAWQHPLYRSEMLLRLEMLQLEATLMLRRLAQLGAVGRWALLAGAMLIAVLLISAYDLTIRGQRTFPV